MGRRVLSGPVDTMKFCGGKLLPVDGRKEPLGSIANQADRALVQFQ